MSTQEDEQLESLLQFLNHQRGFDFTGYKRSSIQRRVAKRMEEVGISSIQDYLEHLELSADEFTELFNTLLINVTAFFRDAPAWEYLRDEVVPQLARRVENGEDLRIWSAGCASGEE